jgi:hypothetical protein
MVVKRALVVVAVLLIVYTVAVVGWDAKNNPLDDGVPAAVYNAAQGAATQAGRTETPQRVPDGDLHCNQRSQGRWQCMAPLERSDGQPDAGFEMSVELYADEFAVVSDLRRSEVPGLGKRHCNAPPATC